MPRQVSDEQRRYGRTATADRFSPSCGVRPALGRSSLLQIRPERGRQGAGGPHDGHPTQPNRPRRIVGHRTHAQSERELAPPTRLAYLSLIDFVPDYEPYEHLTTIDIEPAGDRTKVVMTVDPLRDETWTQGYRAHCGNELDNLEAAIKLRTM
jgi:hypothetical protein